MGNTDEDGSVESGYFMAGDGGEFGGTVNFLLRRNQKERVSLEDLLQKWPSEEALGGPRPAPSLSCSQAANWNPDDEEGNELSLPYDSGALIPIARRAIRQISRSRRQPPLA